MLKSMTGYGRGEYSKDGIWIIVELRSLNNRYRDIVLRIPSNFQWLDVNIRSMVSNRVKRGRVEVSVKMTNTGEIGVFSSRNDKIGKGYPPHVFQQRSNILI